MLTNAWSESLNGLYMWRFSVGKRIHAGTSMNMKLTFQSKFTSTAVITAIASPTLSVLIKQIGDSVNFEYVV